MTDGNLLAIEGSYQLAKLGSSKSHGCRLWEETEML
jgi:hypothetical protein